MGKVCQFKDCERGCYGELCLMHSPKKQPKPGKHTLKDRTENRKFRQSNLNHQGYLVCANCGSWYGSDADHIKKKSLRPDLRYKKSNKQILCRNCHADKDQ